MVTGTIGDITSTTRIVSLTCAACGVVFGLSDRYIQERREDHRTFYCPNQHSNYYPYKTKEERLKEELEAAYEGQASTRRQLAVERKQHAATKGKVTKLRKRAQAGMCVECNRTFSNYARHMETKHSQ